MSYRKACHAPAHHYRDALLPIVIAFLPGIASVQIYGLHMVVTMHDAGMLASRHCKLTSLDFYLVPIGSMLVQIPS